MKRLIHLSLGAFLAFGIFTTNTMEMPEQPIRCTIQFYNATTFNPVILALFDRHERQFAYKSINAQAWSESVQTTNHDFPLLLSIRSGTVSLTREVSLAFNDLINRAGKSLPEGFKGTVQFGIFLYPQSMQVHAELTPLVQANQKDQDKKDKQPAQKECLICFEKQNEDNFCKFTCGHEFCKSCMQTIINQSITERQTQILRCPNPDCHTPLQESDLRQVALAQNALNRLNEIKLQEWIASQPDAKHCPTPNCKFAFINDAHQRQNIQCPSCHQHYCTECLINHEERMTCAQARDMRLATDKNAADKASEEWKKQNTKECPQCHAAIQKNGGCNHITCKNCHKHFCWQCLGDFNGACVNRCPLYGARRVNPAGQANPHGGNNHGRLPVVYPERNHDVLHPDQVHEQLDAYEEERTQLLEAVQRALREIVALDPVRQLRVFRGDHEYLSRFLLRILNDANELNAQLSRGPLRAFGIEMQNLDQRRMELNNIFTNIGVLQHLLNRYNDQ